MPLITCKECKNQISTQSEQCVHCGAPTARSRPTEFTRTGVRAFILSIVAAVIMEIVFIVLLLIRSPESRVSPSTSLILSLCIPLIPIGLAVNAFMRARRGKREAVDMKLRGKGLCIAATVISLATIFVTVVYCILLFMMAAEQGRLEERIHRINPGAFGEHMTHGSVLDSLDPTQEERP